MAAPAAARLAGIGGGGGRIAVYAEDFTSFNPANITANGGGGGGQAAAARRGRTVYLRDTDDLRGTLIIGPAGNQFGSGFTPLGLPGQTTVNIPDDVVVRGNGTIAGPDHYWNDVSDRRLSDRGEKQLA